MALTYLWANCVRLSKFPKIAQPPHEVGTLDCSHFTDEEAEAKLGFASGSFWLQISRLHPQDLLSSCWYKPRHAVCQCDGQRSGRRQRWNGHFFYHGFQARVFKFEVWKLSTLQKMIPQSRNWLSFSNKANFYSTGLLVPILRVRGETSEVITILSKVSAKGWG